MSLSLGWGIVNDVLPPESLRGVRALITGSSRGIGAETAGYLAAAGAKVVINYRNKEARALKVVAGIEARGGEAIAIGADLTDPASVADGSKRTSTVCSPGMVSSAPGGGVADSCVCRATASSAESTSNSSASAP